MDQNIINGQTEIVHRAVQLLTKAAKSWLAPKDDDSHTNIGWNDKGSSFMGHILPGNIQLELSLADFTLNIHQSDTIVSSFELSEKKHADIELAMVQELTKLGLDARAWNSKLHYELPYSNLEEYVYPALNTHAMGQFISLRSFGQKVFEAYEKEHNINLGIRTWPHHFDLGGLSITDKDKEGNATATIGMGLAMHDSGTDEHYFYINHWKKGGIDHYPEPIHLLNGGKWIGETPMAVLKVSDVLIGDNFLLQSTIDFVDQAVKESARFIVLS